MGAPGAEGTTHRVVHLSDVSGRKTAAPHLLRQRIFFSDGPLAIATRDYESRLAEWRTWEPLSVAAHRATA